MWTWIKSTAGKAWVAGVAWISVPANQQTAIDAAKKAAEALKK